MAEADPYRSRFQRSGTFVGKGRAVEPRPYSHPLSAQCLCDLLGIPAADRQGQDPCLPLSAEQADTGYRTQSLCHKGHKDPFPCQDPLGGAAAHIAEPL